MNRRTIIRNATAILPDTTLDGAHVAIEDGKIVGIDTEMRVSEHESIDASGLVLIPGVIDDQVHFREPGLTHKEDLYHASRAAAAGGVTSFFEMPNTSPTTTTVERLHEKLALASDRCWSNYAFFVGATPENVGQLAKAERTPGIKIFIGSSTGELFVDDQEALERIFAETTLPVCAHCEDETLRRENCARVMREAEATGAPLSVADHVRVRDHACALKATERAVDLATRHRHQFHVLHVTTADECRFLAGTPEHITAEACWPHLVFSSEDYDALGTRIQANPSVKAPEDRDAIWQALHDGVLSVVATDHAPHTLEEKAAPYPDSPSGMPSIELSLPLMLTEVHAGRVTWHELVRWMCENPARIWHVPGKGRIEEGSDADLVLVDPGRSFTVRDEDQRTKCGWSPFVGRTLTGSVTHTWVGGRLAFHDGVFCEAPAGREIVFAR